VVSRVDHVGVDVVEGWRERVTIGGLKRPNRTFSSVYFLSREHALPSWWREGPTKWDGSFRVLIKETDGRIKFTTMLHLRKKRKF
jgi:hypothetical protein